MADALGTPAVGGVGVVSDEDYRLDQGAFLATTTSILGIRTGVMHGPGTTALVTGTSATGTMTVAIAAHHWVTSRSTADGVYVGTLEAPTSVTIAAAPGSNSRIDVVYVKQGDASTTVTTGLPTDATSAPVYGVQQGTAAASPTKPTIPVGAVELATVTVATGATSTNGAGVTITNTARQTVARGAPIPVSTQAERDALTVYDSLSVKRLDLGGAAQDRVSGAWKSVLYAGDVTGATLTTASPSYAGTVFAANAVDPLKTYKNQNKIVVVSGLITNPAIVGSIVGTWCILAHPPATGKFGQLAHIEGTGIAVYDIHTDGAVVGVGWDVGGTTVAAGKYWSLNTTYLGA